MAPKPLGRNIELPELEHHAERELEDQRWHGIAKFVALIVFVLLVFWLVESMVTHHFFTGGATNYGNHPTGP